MLDSRGNYITVEAAMERISKSAKSKGLVVARWQFAPMTYYEFISELCPRARFLQDVQEVTYDGAPVVRVPYVSKVEGAPGVFESHLDNVVYFDVVQAKPPVPENATPAGAA